MKLELPTLKEKKLGRFDDAGSYYFKLLAKVIRLGAH